MSKCCGLCRFWQRDQTPPDAQVGTCHRHAPAMLANHTIHAKWPITYNDDWCGEWTSDTRTET